MQTSCDIEIRQCKPWQYTIFSLIFNSIHDLVRHDVMNTLLEGK